MASLRLKEWSILISSAKFALCVVRAEGVLWSANNWGRGEEQAMSGQDHAERRAEDAVVIDGLRLLRAFNAIADPADRQRVIALAVTLAGGPVGPG
jgi:hypothetical protein